MSILTTLSCSTALDQGVHLQRIRPALLSLDQEAHRFRIACAHGDQPSALNGATMFSAETGACTGAVQVDFASA